METKKLETMCGEHISRVTEKAIKLANDDGCIVEFDFNGIPIQVKPDSTVESVLEYFDAECNRRHEEYLASDEYKAHQAEAERKDREQKEKLDKYLALAPEKLTLKDEAEFLAAKEKNSDPYGSGIYRYAESWARIMEGRMASGEKLVDIAQESSHIADTEGITGFMYGAAVSILSGFWIHGEALRRWHNKEVQIGDEGDKANETGGVLNPAILNISPKTDETAAGANA